MDVVPSADDERWNGNLAQTAPYIIPLQFAHDKVLISPRIEFRVRKNRIDRCSRLLCLGIVLIDRPVKLLNPFFLRQ